jgi:hypothetical protein
MSQADNLAALATNVNSSGVLQPASGGTGATTTTGAANAILPSQTGNTGKYLTTNGTDTSWGTVTSNPGTVTSITAGTGLSGGTITSSGTIAIDSTVATLTGAQTLTNKTISGASNTLSNIANASLTNSAITVNSTAISLGGSATITAVNFVISNETGLALAIKDSGGTTREFLQSGGKYTLSITSTATSTGVWYFNNSPILIPIGEQQSVLIPRSSYMTATASTRTSQGLFVKLDSTNFAYVFCENVEGSNPGGSTYAKLFTVNPATGAFTAGNRVTLIGAHSVPYSYDTDNAGHALVACHRSFPSGNLCDTFGLSVSGGTLYASAVNTFNTGGDGVNGSWVAYLGSNSAYSYGVSWATCGGAGTALVVLQ